MRREQPERRWFRARYVVVALFLAVIASCSGITVVTRAYHACDVWMALGWDLIFSLMLLPVLVVICATPLLGSYMLIGRWINSAVMRAGVAVFVTVIIIAILSWAYFARNGLPLRNFSCPGGEPPWWPQWLPPAYKDYP